MNVSNQKILHVKAGHLPPDDLLELLIGWKPNAFGFTVQDVVDGKPDLAVIREDATNMNLVEFKQLFANAKDNPISVWLGKLNAGYNPDDIQPFLIRDGDDNAFITITLEGTLLGNDDPKEHTEQYNYVNGLLIPKIVEWCQDFDGDLEKIRSKLTGDTFKKEFMMHVGHRAVLHIIPLEGDPINLGKNDIGLEDQDWGWCSQKIEPLPKKVEAEKVAEATPTKKKFWGGSAAKTSVPAAGHVQNDKGVYEAPTAASSKSEGEYPAKGKEAGDKDGQSPSLVARMPAWIKTNDDTKLWYDIVSGSVHPQWKKRLPCTIKDMEAVKFNNLADFKTYALGKKLKPTGEGTQTSSGTPPKDLKLITGAVGDKELPIIEPKDLEKILQYVSKFIDGNSKSIIPPTEMQAIEQQLPNFAEAIGMKPEETLNWTLGSLIGIGNTDIRALALYAMMWRLIARPHVKVSTVVTKTEKIGDNSTKQESIDTAAVKKTYWGGKKVA